MPQEKNRILVEGVYAFFASAYGTRQINLRKKRRRPLHNGSLKEVERNKKEAKKELKMAQQRGFSSEVIQSLAQQFFSLVRCHSSLKRSSNTRLLMRNMWVARELCYKNLGRCGKEVLDGNSDHIPAFSEATADVYHSGPRNFVQPEWMPTTIVFTLAVYIMIILPFAHSLEHLLTTHCIVVIHTHNKYVHVHNVHMHIRTVYMIYNYAHVHNT